MVLGREGAAYETQRRLFRLGLGGKLGSGRQWTPWIHVTDAVRLLLHCVENSIVGPVNGCAPESPTNADFTQKFAASLHRPAFMPAPAFALRMLPGGLGNVFLDSVRMTPEVAVKSGFQFEFSTLDACLKDLAG
jgi:NAD dependent epimerase/dehydratase family enzyme